MLEKTLLDLYYQEEPYMLRLRVLLHTVPQEQRKQSHLSPAKRQQSLYHLFPMPLGRACVLQEDAKPAIKEEIINGRYVIVLLKTLKCV